MALVAFLVAGLINRRSLCNAVVVTPPDDVCALGEVQDALHSFPSTISINVDKIDTREHTGS
jgi:hypothetical protein